jgi:hypothetical protein
VASWRRRRLNSEGMQSTVQSQSTKMKCIGFHFFSSLFIFFSLGKKKKESCLTGDPWHDQFKQDKDPNMFRINPYQLISYRLRVGFMGRVKIASPREDCK